jgi:hypothetical protein
MEAKASGDENSVDTLGGWTLGGAGSAADGIVGFTASSTSLSLGRRWGLLPLQLVSLSRAWVEERGDGLAAVSGRDEQPQNLRVPGLRRRLVCHNERLVGLVRWEVMPNRGVGPGKEDETAVSPSKHYVPTEFSIAKEQGRFPSSRAVAWMD